MQKLNGYLTEFLQEQSVTKLTLKKGDSSEVIQKISIEGEINAEMRILIQEVLY